MKRVLLFAPAAYNLAETSRMVEIAKAVRKDASCRNAFDIHFISEGGDFEKLVLDSGFTLTTIEPRITQEKIAHIGAVNDEEKFAPIYSKQEMIRKVSLDIEQLKAIKPAAVITGSYLSMPVACRVLGIPLVWTVQSTWFQAFFASGAGITDGLRPKLLKKAVDLGVYSMIRFWMWYCFIHSVNQAAKHFGVSGFRPVFSYFQGDVTLVAEPPEFSGASLPAHHYFIGPLIVQQSFAMPEAFRNLKRDLPLVYFAMGSSGTAKVVAQILESFQDKPYQVVAPVKFIIDKVPNLAIPPNVTVTDWLPALEVNKLADISVIHGGIGTVMTAAYAGKPVVGVGMQPEQVANLACLVRKGFAIRVSRSGKVGVKVQRAIERLLRDEEAKRNAREFAERPSGWDGPQRAAQVLLDRFGKA